jgi:hypothetical protein
MSQNMPIATQANPQFAFASALNAYRQAHQVHSLVLAAVDPLGDRISSQAEHDAIEAAEAAVADLSARRWADLMETPAPDLEALRLKLETFFELQGDLPADCGPVYRGDNPVSERAALCRIVWDLRRLAGVATIAQAA